MGLGLGQKIRAIGNHIRRVTGTGNYWYWIEGSELDEDIEIASLVYPLRYDIVIRKDFFNFYKTNRDAYNDNFQAFFDEAREHVYYQWFRNVLVPRFKPELSGNTEAIDIVYLDRVQKSAALFDAIEKSGFDARHPILPYTGETILPTSTGVRTEAKYFMGDGCHRLAYLMSTGHKRVPANHVRVKCYRELTPLDNTSLIAPYINIDWNAAGLDLK